MTAARLINMISRCAIVTSVVLLACIACAKLNSHRALTAEGARESLIDWVQSQQDAGLKLSLHSLRTALVENAGGGNVKIANWEVNLGSHTFGVVFAGKDWFHAINGEFVFDAASNAWRVRILQETQT
jgi:hypothetical protein